MDGYLRQATASQSRTIGPFIDSTDFVSVKTGLTIANTDIKLMANGGASASKNSGGGTHLQSGHYGVTFDATDTATVGELTGSIVVATALPVWFKFVVVEEAVYDALFVAAAPGYVVDQPVNATKIGGTSQTGRDIGASVLLSSGTGTGQLDFTSGVVKANTVQLLGTAWLTPGTAGTPDVNVKLWNALATVDLPLVPTTAGRKLDVSVGGEAGVDWANVGSPTTSLALTGTTIAVTQKVDVETIKTNPVVNAGTVTFPTTATLASTTNITAGTITTATNVTNVSAGGIAASSFAAGAIDAAAIGTDAIDADALKADAVTEIQSGLSTLTAAGVRTAVGLASANLDTQLGAIDDFVDTEMAAALAILVKLNTTMESTGSPTDYVFTARALAQAPSGTGASAIAIADEVQTRTIAGVTLVTTTTNLTNAPTAGDLTATMKASVTTAATAATPIAASVTGAVGSVTGNVGGNVTGSVGSVVGAVASVTAGVTVTTNNDKTGYALSTAGNAAVADKLLGRNLAGGSDGTRTVQDALRSLRNKTSIAGGTLTVTQEDDSTPAWTAVVTTTAGDPLSSIDPA